MRPATSSFAPAPMSQTWRAIAAVLRNLEPDIRGHQSCRCGRVVAGALTRPRFYAAAVASFALTAVLLAGFGIFGTRDLSGHGTPARVWRPSGARCVARERAAARGPGGAVPTPRTHAGVPLALAAGRLVREQLYGISPSDVPTILAVAGFDGHHAVAAVAPALKATASIPWSCSNMTPPVETFDH